MDTRPETTCQAVMNRNPLFLKTDDTVAKALSLLLENHLLALPIVDNEKRYLGMFLKSRLISMLLPAGVKVGEAVHHISQMPDIGFMTINVQHLRQAYAAIADQPVVRFVDVDTPVFRPDSPLSSALLQLYRTRNFVPVVEKGTDQLIGMISTWDILGSLSADQDVLQPA